MSQEFDAIYTQGHLVPLEPVKLREQQRVRVHVEQVQERPVADLVGFLADEPELADRIMEDVYRTREAQSLRTPPNGSGPS